MIINWKAENTFLMLACTKEWPWTRQPLVAYLFRGTEQNLLVTSHLPHRERTHGMVVYIRLITRVLQSALKDKKDYRVKTNVKGQKYIYYKDYKPGSIKMVRLKIPSNSSPRQA